MRECDRCERASASRKLLNYSICDECFEFISKVIRHWIADNSQLKYFKELNAYIERKEL
jgi:hypothetical protein